MKKAQNQVPSKQMLADFYSAPSPNNANQAPLPQISLAKLSTVSAQNPSNNFPNQSHFQKETTHIQGAKAEQKNAKRSLHFVEAHYKITKNHYKIITYSLQNHYKIKHA